MGTSQTLTIGTWTITPAQNLLEERGGERVQLKPRAMEVLVFLARHAGEVVSTEELIESVWRGRVVGDGTVYQSIAQIRHALGDRKGAACYVQTIPKRGYRLIAPVRFLEPPSSAEAWPASGVLAPARARWGQRWKHGFAIAGALALALAILLVRYGAEDPAPTGVADRSIAVLPFENLSTDPDDAYFTSGIHNDLLAHLARLGDLKVISRTSVLEYEGQPRNLREIGEQLGVATILEGSVQRDGDAVRINVQLIDADSDRHLWARIYDTKLAAGGILSVQNDIATAIAQALEVTLSGPELAGLQEIPTQSPRAYEFYLSGQYYFERSDWDASMPLAAQQYRRAVEEDPKFAAAWAALARAHLIMYRMRYLDPTESRLRMAEAALERARQLAPDSPETHLVFGQYYRNLGNYEAALDEYAAAEIGLPGDSRVYRARAEVLRLAGKFEQSLAAMERAIQLDPRNVAQLESHARTYMMLRDYAQAESWFRYVREIRPDSLAAFVYLEGYIPLYRDGDYAAVYRGLENPLAALANGDERQNLGWLAALYERDYAKALSYLDGWDANADGKINRYLPKDSFYGITYHLAGQDALARRYFLAARAQIEQSIAQLTRTPSRGVPVEHPLLLTALAEASTGLGDHETARRLARESMDMVPTAKNAYWGPTLHEEAILKALVAAEDKGVVIAELDAYLAAPGQWSIEGLLPDPRLDPLRGDPRFVALVEKYRRRPLPEAEYADSSIR